MILGKEEADDGSIKIGETVNVVSVGQERMDELNPDKTVFEEISGGLDEIELGTQSVQSRAYLSWFGFKGAQQQAYVGNLSGGERNRVQLAKILKAGGNMIILDEPSNDLDVEVLRSLEEALLNFAGCALVVSHDRYFLDRVATHILACEGDSKWFFFPGNYAEYEVRILKTLSWCAFTSSLLLAYLQPCSLPAKPGKSGAASRGKKHQAYHLRPISECIERIARYNYFNQSAARNFLVVIVLLDVGYDKREVPNDLYLSQLHS